MVFFVNPVTWCPVSQAIERAIRRQQAIQQSRGTAWIMFIVMLPVALLSALALIQAAVQGSLLSLNGIVSAVITVSAVWVSGHLFREARRLGKLLKDPALIMRLERDPDLVTELQWSTLLPFSHWRG